MSKHDFPVNFEYNKEFGYLDAIRSPGSNTAKLTEKLLEKALAEAGYSDLFFLKQNLAPLLDNQSNVTPIRIRIAERLDAKATITVSEDLLQAYVTIEKPFGGSPITEDKLNEAIAEAGITYGIKNDSIKRALKMLSSEPILFAEGKKPMDGVGARFKSLLPEQNTGPKIDEKGVVDFLNIREFITVEPGQELMRCIPGHPPENGMDVYGQVVPAKKSGSLSFKTDLTGVKFSEQDNNLLIADVKGHPIIYPNGISVQNTLQLPQADISTGNVKFDGSIHIKGDVESGLMVSASGDILIDGMVGSSVIIAGGNVTIQHGVMGGALRLDKPNNSINEKGARIDVKGSLTSGYLDNVFVNANDSIFVKNNVSHCFLKAHNTITVGEKHNGQIIGGHLTAMHTIKTDTLGSKAEIETLVEVGIAPDIREKYNHYIAFIEEKEEEKEEAHKTIQYFMKKSKKLDPEKKIKLEEKVQKITEFIESLNREIILTKIKRDELSPHLESAHEAKVIVTQCSYRGGIVRIQDKNRVIKERSGSGLYILEDNEVIKKPLSD